MAGDVLLSAGFQAKGTVNLAGALVEGSLICSGGIFNAEDENALFAPGINVTSFVFLNFGFQATGGVFLAGATIGGFLGCQGGVFINDNGDALSAPRIDVSGNVVLGEGFQAIGRVFLAGATIGGNFSCKKGMFTNTHSDNDKKGALLAPNINVAGNVELSSGFRAMGEVSLANGSIRGSLDCNSGKFNNENEVALLAEHLQVVGSVFLRYGFQAKGTVHLSGATVEGALICIGGKFINHRREALIALNINVTGAVLLTSGFEADGRVSFAGASIGGSLFCNGGRFTNDKEAALLAASINVTGDVFLNMNFRARGMVILVGASIGGDLNCSGGTFISNRNSALNAENVNIKGNVFLSDGFRSQGKIFLTGASIDKNLICTGGVFSELIAESISVTSSVALNGGFQAKGKIILVNARIGNTLQITGSRGWQLNGMPLVWMLLQKSNRTVKILFLRKSPLKASKEIRLNLQFAKVQTFDHSERSFPTPGHLRLNGLVYETLAGNLLDNSALHLRWLRLQPKAPFSPQPYEQLAKVLQSSGKKDEAVRVLIGKEDDELKYGDLGWVRKVWKPFLGVSIAYGYRPELALIWSLGIVIIGCFFFGSGYRNGLVTPTDKDCKLVVPNFVNDCSNNVNYPKFNEYIYSLDVFLPIIDLRLKNAWLPNANNISSNSGRFEFKSGAQLRYYFWFQTMAGWVLTTLWVAGFTGLVRNTNK